MTWAEAAVSRASQTENPNPKVRRAKFLMQTGYFAKPRLVLRASPVESFPVKASKPTQAGLDLKPGDLQQEAPKSRWSRGLRLLRPSHAHTAFTATILLMASTFLSRIIGLVRVKYIVWLFGAGVEADALNGAFVLPDMISYFLVGGAASITFVTILTRYRETGREAEGQRSLSVIVTTMCLVLGGAILLTEVFAPWYIHWWFSGFDARKAALCVHLTRILLPAQLFFFAGGVFGAVPLMIGVSLVTADNWIIAHFASATNGAVSLMSYAKQLFSAPMAMLAQAAGAASMPFFASMWSQKRHYEFATGVADSVSRVAAMGLLAASGMVVLAAPLVELLFLGGRFSSPDAREC